MSNAWKSDTDVAYCLEGETKNFPKHLYSYDSGLTFFNDSRGGNTFRKRDVGNGGDVKWVPDIDVPDVSLYDEIVMEKIHKVQQDGHDGYKYGKSCSEEGNGCKKNPIGYYSDDNENEFDIYECEKPIYKNVLCQYIHSCGEDTNPDPAYMDGNYFCVQWRKFPSSDNSFVQRGYDGDGAYPDFWGLPYFTPYIGYPSETEWIWCVSNTETWGGGVMDGTCADRVGSSTNLLMNYPCNGDIYSPFSQSYHGHIMDLFYCGPPEWIDLASGYKYCPPRDP